MQLSQRITPCLWFDNQAEDAANFYMSVFKNSKIGIVSRYSDAGKETHRRPVGSVMTVAFELDGQPFTALERRAGLHVQRSRVAAGELQGSERDRLLLEKLSQGGDPEAQQCGWLKDKFGLSWQVVPAALPEMLKDSESAGASA